MNVVQSSLSVERYVQLPLFEGILLPKYAESVLEPTPDLVGDVSNHPEFPSLFCRFLKVLISCLPIAFSRIKLDEKKYRFDFLNDTASIQFVTLDNPPIDQSSKTSLGEAKATLDKLWGHGFCPLDYFSFRRIVDDTLRDDALTEILEKRYGRYHSVYILFADPIRLGENQEEHFLVYELRYGLEHAHLTVMHENKLISLFAGETVIAACVSCEDVIMRPEFESKQSKTTAVDLPRGGFHDDQPKGEDSPLQSLFRENARRRQCLPLATPR